jgi:hypothetical protein
MPESAPRPGQATLAGWLIIGGSVILVFTAWQRISNLHTLEVQEELQRVLSEPPLSGTGLGLEGLKTTIRVLCMVGAAAATASTILGVQALRRSTSARLALTLLAPLVLIGGFATAGFFAPLVVAGVCMLWLRPTRDWFAGRPWMNPTAALAQRRADRPAGPDPFASPPHRTSEDSAPQAPPPTTPAPPHQPSPPAPQTGPKPFEGEFGAPLPESAPQAPGPPSPYGAGAKRPGALIAACIVVWASCAATAGFMLLFSLVMAVARDEFFDEVERQQPNLDMQGLSEAELAMGTFVATAFIVVWCAVAVVLAVLAFRRIAWARIALVVSAAVAGLMLLVATFISPFLVLLLGAAAVTLWLLLRPEVSAWYRR